MVKLILEQLVDEKTKQIREEEEIAIKSEKVIQEKNQEFRDSLTHAKPVQEALLTKGDLLNKYKHQLFVFYQPKDTVSDDFYWMAEVPALKIILAADYTGSRVRGALMSIMVSTLLNKIDNE
jgi:serine phosphatase RsbU (regulator of sigma subunit)